MSNQSVWWHRQSQCLKQITKEWPAYAFFEFCSSDQCWWIMSVLLQEKTINEISPMICNIVLLIYELEMTVGIQVFPVRQHHHCIQLGFCIYPRYLFSVAHSVAIGWEVFPFRKKLFIQERTHFIYWATLWVLVTYLDYCKGNLSFLSILQFLVKVQDHPCLHYHVSNFLKGLHLKQAADGRIRTVQMKLANLIFQWISHGQQLSLWQFNWNLIFFCWFSYQKVMLLK